MSKPSIKSIKQANGKSYELVCAKDVIIRAKQWVWPGHLLRGAQELLTGIPGLGKSQTQIHFIGCVSAGLAWPDGAKALPPANVIMLTAEDVLQDEVVPRLLAANANVERVHILKKIRKDGQDRQFLLGEDLDMLARAVAEIGEVGLITIDPITAYMGGKVDSHRTTEVRSQLGPLKDFAEGHNIAISTITHPPKSAGQKAIDHFIGSQAFIAAGRIGHVCVGEVEEEADGTKTPTGRYLFANAKNNPHTKMPTLAYRIAETVVGRDAETHDNIAAPHVVWEGAVDITADQAVGAASQGEGKKKQRGQQEKVQAFLQSIMNRAQPELLGGGPTVDARVAIAEAAKQGITEEQLKTARQKMGISSTQTPNGWVWREEDF
ncbi:AAA family ATPase [Bradyrhizobium sp. 6(2017)]|uniref:AAA family ATPase n=1 Tax=Bradyrhizobium sp. 6(2017) TaxID=1197460 RepID=UPI0013E18A3C|nr:AAA family ATPase [Bradyrhizobium sp. 6(2017)]QIG92784.1 AAA family ATPase [Bradyrhizobium sp. 6(2017)]